MNMHDLVSPCTDADLLHRTLQLSNLVELDLSGIALPQDLHQHLKVSRYTTVFVFPFKLQ